MVKECSRCGVIKRGCQKIIEYEDGHMAFNLWLAERNNRTEVSNNNAMYEQKYPIDKYRKMMADVKKHFEGNYICKGCFLNRKRWDKTEITDDQSITETGKIVFDKLVVEKYGSIL